MLAHKEELVRQAAATIAASNPLLSVKIDMNTLKPDHATDVIIGSVPTLVRMSRLECYNPDEFQTIILDECHHATASLWMKILDYFGALSPELKIRVIGFTATMERADGDLLGKVFEKIVFERTLETMIRAKELCDVRFSTLDAPVNLKKVPTRLGDYSVKELSKEVNRESINLQVVRAYLDLRKEYDFRLTLVFCVDIEHCKTLCGVLQANGVNAQYVTGDTVKDERYAILQDFKEGKISVLCNVLVFTEGTDLPNIDSLILARPTKSRPLLVQMVGRGLRLHHGKTYCHVVDMVLTSDIGVSLVPTLFGLPSTFKTHGKTFDELEEDKKAYDEDEERKKAEEQRLHVQQTIELQEKMKNLTLLMTTVDGFFDYYAAQEEKFGDTKVVLKALRDLVLPWVRLEYNVWALQCSKDQYILERTTNPLNFTFSRYHATLPALLRENKFKMPRYRLYEDFSSKNLKAVIMHATNKCYERHWFMTVAKKPASESQRKYLSRLLRAKTKALYGEERLDDLDLALARLTMLQAASLIFAVKWLINSLCVLWELRSMLGPTKGMEKKMKAAQRKLDLQ